MHESMDVRPKGDRCIAIRESSKAAVVVAKTFPSQTEPSEMTTPNRPLIPSHLERASARLLQPALVALVWLAALTGSPSDVRADEVAEPLAPIPMLAPTPVGQPFGPAEMLTFKASYLGLTIGKVEIIVGSETPMNGAKVLPVIAVAKTDALFALYPVKNRYVTWWDPASRITVGNELQAEERSERRRERVRFDRTAQSANTLRERPGKTPKDSRYEVPSAAQDILSALLYLRGIPLSVGENYEIPVFTGAKNFMLKAAIDRREQVETPAGTFDALVLKVQVEFSGQLASKRDIFVWVTDDARHVPLRFDASFQFGTLIAELTTYQKGLSR